MNNDIKQVIVVRKDLNMRKGKIAAQVAHAAMKFIIVDSNFENDCIVIKHLTPVQHEWLKSLFTKIVLGVDSEEELLSLIEIAKKSKIVVHEIIDSGKTEFNGVATLTCAAFGPEYSSVLDRITGELKLI